MRQGCHDGNKIILMTKNLKLKNAQSTLEFSFSMIAILLLIYGCVMIFRWSGVSLAERRIAHDDVLVTVVPDNYVQDLYSFPWGGGGPTPTPLIQVRPHFYTPESMNFVFRGW